MTLPQLVECERYSCRLTLRACRKRYGKARKPTTVMDALNGHSTTHTQACWGCKQGEERSHGAE